MCAVRSVHACYVIYNDADSKLSLTQQNRGRHHYFRTLSVSVRPLKAIIAGGKLLFKII